MKPAARALSALMALHAALGLTAHAASYQWPARFSSHLSSPRANPGGLIPILETIRRQPPTAGVQLSAADATALEQRAARLAAQAAAAEARTPAVREAHYELLLLRRELGPWLAPASARRIESARRQTAAVLERRLLEDASLAARALAMTRAPLEARAVDDASRVNRTAVHAVIEPRNEAEVLAALDYARRKGLKVSVSGARHSQGGQIVSKGSLHLNMDRLKGATLNAQGDRLTVQAGAFWADLIPFLDAHGKSLDVTQVPNYFAVGAAVAVNPHGHNVDAGPVASTVESLRIALADGRVVRASREENRELFSLTLGGYGLFGVVLEAVLRVRDNAVYTPDFHVVKTEDFTAFHAAELAGGPRARYAHSLLSIAPGSFLKEVMVTRYREVQDSVRIPGLVRSTWREGFERLISDTLNALYRGPGVTRRLGWWLITRVLHPLAQKEQTRNRVMSEPFTHFSNGNPRRAQILQEYFVPRKHFAQFIEKSREILARSPIHLVMVSVRAVKADSDAFMAYAPTDRFGVVFISHHPLSAAEMRRLDEATRGLVAASLSVGGTFYLPYRPAASLAQVRQAYPQADAFFAAQAAYDPDGRFSNKLRERYASADPHNATDQWNAAWDAARQPLSGLDASKLRGHRVLFVNGLLGDVYKKVGQYFDASLVELRQYGVDARHVATNTQGTIDANEKAIAEAIEASDKPVLLVTHSKGGLDVLNTLLKRPDLRSKVKAWGAIQAPFGGSPVADWFLRHALPARISETVLKFWGGGNDAMRDLSTQQRERFLMLNAGSIAEVLEQVPVFTLATWKEPHAWWRWDTVLLWARNAMLKRGIRSDGLVPVESAVLDGADFAVVEGVDHKVPVMPSLVLRFDRRQMTRALMTMLLARAQPRGGGAPPKPDATPGR